MEKTVNFWRFSWIELKFDSVASVVGLIITQAVYFVKASAVKKSAELLKLGKTPLICGRSRGDHSDPWPSYEPFLWRTMGRGESPRQEKQSASLDKSRERRYNALNATDDSAPSA